MILLNDGPGPFDTLETWEQHLKKMEALPESVLNRGSLIAEARTWVERKRDERGPGSRT
jgi:hypothetical protein